jgi:hypothetical protein
MDNNVAFGSTDSRDGYLDECVIAYEQYLSDYALLCEVAISAGLAHRPTDNQPPSRARASTRRHIELMLKPARRNHPGAPPVSRLLLSMQRSSEAHPSFESDDRDLIGRLSNPRVREMLRDLRERAHLIPPL